MTTKTNKKPPAAKKATEVKPDYSKEEVPAPTKVEVTFTEDGQVDKIEISPKEFYSLPLAVRGELLMKARNIVEKEYLHIVKEYAQTESLAQARHLFGAEDQKKAM
jgi:hypothetical protein